MLALLVVVVLFLVASDAQGTVQISSDYPSEKHSVTTSDGYILDLYRIQPSDSDISNGKVALLLHCYPLGYNSFIFAGPKKSLAYSLADTGYDVWIGNARGNTYSRKNIFLDPDRESSKFFDFTYEEIGLYDLPAMTDYVLAATNKQKLYFVGHSHGATAFLVLNSMNTTYNSKFAAAHLLAAMGYENHFSNEIILQLDSATDIIYNALVFSDYFELKPVGFTNMYFTLLTNSDLPDGLDAGTSVKQSVHFCQNQRDRAFRRFDYGRAGNLVKYGSETPPSYDLSKVNVSSILYYSVSDITISEQDTLAMAQAMPRAVARKVSDDFITMDYLINGNIMGM